MPRSVCLAVLAGVAAASIAVAACSSTSAEATPRPAPTLARPLAAVGASKLEGRWKTKRATLQEFLAAGTPRSVAEALARLRIKTPGLDFHNGAFKGLDLDTGQVHGTGTYRLDGALIRFVFRTGVGVHLGTPYLLRWNVYRDRLTFSSLPGRPSLVFTINPWTRVR